MFDFFNEEIEMDATTVNGWVVRELDRLPKAGDAFAFDDGGQIYHVKVTKADNRKALEINLKVEEKQEEETEERGRSSK
ncbi:MAG: HlyC/CorC family transporter, partial [Eubacterium sp.]|nr:HlyC/CorC family transporter [Eubacterium sp.]